MGKLYLVGGAVRDLYLGKKPKDLDYVLDVPSFQDLLDYVSDKGGQVYQEREEYGIVRAHLPTLGAVDLAIPRQDINYDGRRPEKVLLGCGIEADLSRRDFTMNAMAREVHEDGSLGEILDPFEGRKHLSQNVLHTVGSASDRFHEDRLRLVRALRFSLVYDLIMSREIQEILVSKDSMFLDNIPTERIQVEVQKMLDVGLHKFMTFFRISPWAAYNLIFSRPELGFKAFTKH